MQIKENNLIGKIKQRIQYHVGLLDMPTLLFEGLLCLIITLTIGLYIYALITQSKYTLYMTLFVICSVLFIFVSGCICELIKRKLKNE